MDQRIAYQVCQGTPNRSFDSKHHDTALRSPLQRELDPGIQRRRAEIRKDLPRQGWRPGLYELRVQDEGFGFDLEDPKSRLSGLGLVRAFTQRLGGSFSVERTPGARCTVRFPDR